MRPRTTQLATLALVLGLAHSTTASAAPIIVELNQSNVLTDRTGYLQVSISEGMEGAIDFAVQVLDPLLQIAGENFGIQSFALNVIPGGYAESASVTDLPDGWIVRDAYRMENFGLFDIKLYGGGASRLDTLNFSITGIDGDRPEDYAVLSTGNATDGHQAFAARVADLVPGTCSVKNCAAITSAFFGGSTAVPAPAAGWLFVTGGLLLAGRLRRRRA